MTDHEHLTQVILMPNKFKKFGGGGLVPVRTDIKATSNRISLNRGAEILAINASKYVFCSCYRVGTLGSDNHDNIINSLKSFYKSKNPKKIFILGDFNLSSVTWPLDDNALIRNPIEKLFVNSFSDLGLL